MSADAFHMTGMAPEGEGCFRAMTRAEGRGHLAGQDRLRQRPRDLDAAGRCAGVEGDRECLRRARAEPHAAGQLDQVDDRAPAGRRGRPRGRHHHSGDADQTAPPTMNIVELDPECRLNYVPNKPQKAKIDYALSNSFGFGGTNGSLVFKRWTHSQSTSIDVASLSNHCGVSAGR
jgi:3-oxoacyl-[acyl-carrier-protein] synthase II